MLLLMIMLMMIDDGDDDDIADKDDVQVPPCDLLAGQQHYKCSCCATSSSLWGVLQEEKAFFPKIEPFSLLIFSPRCPEPWVSWCLLIGWVSTPTWRWNTKEIWGWSRKNIHYKLLLTRRWKIQLFQAVLGQGYFAALVPNFQLEYAEKEVDCQNTLKIFNHRGRTSGKKMLI